MTSKKSPANISNLVAELLPPQIPGIGSVPRAETSLSLTDNIPQTQEQQGQQRALGVACRDRAMSYFDGIEIRHPGYSNLIPIPIEKEDGVKVDLIPLGANVRAEASWHGQLLAQIDKGPKFRGNPDDAVYTLCGFESVTGSYRRVLLQYFEIGHDRWLEGLLEDENGNLTIQVKDSKGIEAISGFVGLQVNPQ